LNPFQQAEQNAANDAHQPADLSDDEDLPIDNSPYRPTTPLNTAPATPLQTGPATAPKKKHQMTKEFTDAYEQAFGEKPPAKPTLPARQTYTPANAVNSTNKNRVATETSLPKPRGRYLKPIELKQVMTEAEKKQARQAEAFAKAIGPQDYS